MRRGIGVLCLPLVLATGACASIGKATGLVKPFYVSVNALAAAGSDTLRDYVLFSGLPGVDSSSLEFDEVRKYVDHTMASRGLRRADSPGNASLALFVDYGIGAPQQVTVSSAVYGFTGGTSTVVVQTPGGQATTAQVTTPQTMQRVGTNVSTTTVYTRFLRILAIDVARSRVERKPVEAWTMTMVSTGSSGDIRTLLPVMFVAAQPHVGRRTDRAVSHKIWEGDRRLVELRQAAARP